MRTLFNLTTSSNDMDRFSSQSELLSLMEGFDGVELMCFEEDERGVIPKERVFGLHMSFFPCWLDFYNSDTAALYKEFDTRENWEAYYGGRDASALTERFRRDLINAHRYNARYVVFHVSDSTIEESFTGNYRHTDIEVIDAVCALINDLFSREDGSLLLLFENLWQPGLTLTDPDMTARLLNGVRYANKGLMLDTGHLLHMNTDLTTQEEGLEYINSMLDAHGALTANIRGIHLNQSLTGGYVKRIRSDPPKLGETFSKRYEQMFMHAFSTDRHLPFTANGVDRLVERIAPECLTFEFITDGIEQHRRFLDEQRRALFLR